MLPKQKVPSLKVCPNCGYSGWLGLWCPICRSIGGWYVFEFIILGGVMGTLCVACFGLTFWYPVLAAWIG